MGGTEKQPPNQSPEVIVQTIRDAMATFKLETIEQIEEAIIFVSSCELQLNKIGIVDEANEYLHEVRSFKGMLGRLLGIVHDQN